MLKRWSCVLPGFPNKKLSVVKVSNEIAVQQKWKSTPWFLLGAQRLETMLNDV